MHDYACFSSKRLIKQINLHDVARPNPGKDRGKRLRSRDTVFKGFASVGEERVVSLRLRLDGGLSFELMNEILILLQQRISKTSV